MEKPSTSSLRSAERSARPFGVVGVGLTLALGFIAELGKHALLSWVSETIGTEASKAAPLRSILSHPFVPAIGAFAIYCVCIVVLAYMKDAKKPEYESPVSGDQITANAEENSRATAIGSIKQGDNSTLHIGDVINPAQQAALQSESSKGTPSSADQKTLSTGGRGGNAKIVGSGIAIGGPGGNAGKYGRGGDGGGGELHGHGLVAGGAGGSVDSDDLWSPPAQSGYEVAMAGLGQPVDPKMRQYGRGGMSPGYASRYAIVEKIRQEYFQHHHKTPETPLENVNAVPLDYVNQRLGLMGIAWRARVVRDLDYEFYVPSREIHRI